MLWRFFDEAQSPLEKFEATFAAELAAENPAYTPGTLAAQEQQRVLGMTATWFGICDGSSEASLAFAEPKTVLKAGGTLFHPYEIKALLSYFTAMSSTQRRLVFAGARVEFEDPLFDAMGRGLDPRFRDVNPGLFHLALANYLGVRKRGLVADVVPNQVVLNFPMKAYRVVSSLPVTEPAEIEARKAHNASAASFVAVRTEVDYGESHRVLEALPGDLDPTMTLSYDYVLELDADGRIVGGEWSGASKAEHPDFLWLPADAELDVKSLQTGRLGQDLKVGAALDALLRSPAAEEGPAELERLRAHADNLAGYRIFKGQVMPPLPAHVEAAIGDQL